MPNSASSSSAAEQRLVMINRKQVDSVRKSRAISVYHKFFAELGCFLFEIHEYVKNQTIEKTCCNKNLGMANLNRPKIVKITSLLFE